MSMLTPPGMGGKYRITGDRYPRMRKPRGNRRRVLATAAAAAALGVLGWGSWQLLDVFSGNSSAVASGDNSGDHCVPPSGESTGAKADGDVKDAKGPDGEKAHPKPESITVNVLNATEKSGLAKSTAKELKKRGFKVGDIDNAPAALDKKVKNTALFLGAPGADTTANFEVLATQLKDSETKYDGRKGNDIDFVLGDAFKELVKKKAAEKALAGLDKPEPTPTPAACRK